MNKNIILKENIIKDPHHGGSCEFGYYNNKFYHRQINTKNWTEVKKIHLTPKRIIALSKIINI